jgi:N-acetylglucosaminyldiphosphoundecaprenol N-acetyl-beta-D-mannosaminyltransferase
MDKLNFAGIPFCALDADEATDFVVDLAKKDNGGASIHFLNAYSVALAETDPNFRDCVSTSDYNFPDGKPISVLSRMSKPKLHQVRGPGLFENVMDRGREVGLKHYLLGSTPDTLRKLQDKLELRFPGVEIAGAYSPPFRPMTEDELNNQDEEIRTSGAHIVWVGLGTPKQDFETARLASVGLTAAAVGAAFDFSAGTKALSPAWMSAVGLEWLHRFMSEPRRLWKRYLWGNSVFLLAAVKHGLSR